MYHLECLLRDGSISPQLGVFPLHIKQGGDLFFHLPQDRLATTAVDALECPPRPSGLSFPLAFAFPLAFPLRNLWGQPILQPLDFLLVHTADLALPLTQLLPHLLLQLLGHPPRDPLHPIL